MVLEPAFWKNQVLTWNTSKNQVLQKEPTNLWVLGSLGIYIIYVPWEPKPLKNVGSKIKPRFPGISDENTGFCIEIPGFPIKPWVLGPTLKIHRIQHIYPYLIRHVQLESKFIRDSERDNYKCIMSHICMTNRLHIHTKNRSITQILTHTNISQQKSKPYIEGMWRCVCFGMDHNWYLGICWPG